ncbi:MAG: hypothetical protein Tsb0010_01360 [Parvularculaceae bacterium]
MNDRAKLLPAAAIAMALLFGLKVVSLWTGLSATLSAQAVAQESPGAETAAAGAEPETAAESAPVGEEAQPEYTATERAVLETLSDRRASLDARERELDTREKLLVAAEARVDERIGELKAIEARISTLLRQRDEAEEAQIRSLVKVYERMKPADAARIFESLDKQILLDVASLMKEQALGGVLAQMQPQAAQELTERLATRLALPEPGEGD